MGINIIDGFNVNASAPVDYRIVASNSTDRDAIFYKYDGLKVFLLSDRKTYTYNTTTATWSSDISGTANTLAMFGTAGTGVVDSIVSQTVAGVSATLGINSPNSTITSSGTVSVVGAAGLFTIVSLFPLVINYTRGGNVRLIAGSGVASGYAGHVYICGGVSDGNVYIGYNGGSFVGKIGVKTTTFDTGFDYQIAPNTAFNSTVRFKSITETTANAYFYNSTTSLTSSAYIRSTNNYSTPLVPDYTWYNNDQVGMYHPASNTIGFAIAGATAAVINSNRQIEVTKASSVSLPSIAINGDLNTGIGQLTSDGADTLGIIAGGVKRLTVRSYELSADIHRTATGGATANHQNPAIGSGAYTPTLSTTVNITSSVAGSFQWIRVGNVVTVSGQLDITPTSNATLTSIDISLPAPTTVASYGRISGAAPSLTGTSPAGVTAVIHGGANNKARMVFTSGATTNWTWLVHFTYLVTDESGFL